MNWTRRLLRAYLYLLFVLFAGSVLLFALLELWPGLVDPARLEGIRYYRVKQRYQPDPELVYASRRTDYSVEFEGRGDLYSPKYGIEVPPVRGVMSYGEDGFRRSTSTPPHDVLVIGDSFVEIGSDGDTFADALAEASGLSTRTLGRAGYGPQQYVVLLRRFGPGSPARYALLCFFEGNDLRDIAQYRKWHEGGRYYDIPAKEPSFPVRYWTVLSSVSEGIERAIRYRRYALMQRLQGPPEEPNRDLALVALGGSTLEMRFAYHTDPREPDELLRSADWQTLRTLLSGFGQASRELGITPIVLFIPIKYRIYGPLASQESGAGFLALRRQQPPSAPSARGALARLAKELGLELVDLTPDFRERAERGELLYAAFDTHWNTAGRRAAAERVARRLAVQAPAPPGQRAARRRE